jgi:hypothetical protein
MTLLSRRLAKVHEHCSGTTPQADPLGVGSLPFSARRGFPWLLPPASSRTLCHSITSSARARTVRENFVACDVLSQLQRVMDAALSTYRRMRAAERRTSGPYLRKPRAICLYLSSRHDHAMQMDTQESVVEIRRERFAFSRLASDRCSVARAFRATGPFLKPPCCAGILIRFRLVHRET